MAVTLVADDLLWELPYAAALGHPLRLSGRDEVTRHVSWFVNAVENFRFFDLRVHAFADPESAVAEVKARGTHQDDGADIPSGLCPIFARRRRENLFPSRILRSHTRGSGPQCSNSRKSNLERSIVVGVEFHAGNGPLPRRHGRGQKRSAGAEPQFVYACVCSSESENAFSLVFTAAGFSAKKFVYDERNAFVGCY